MQKKVIGLAGEIASGKGTVAEYIKSKYGGSIHRFSTMLRDVLDRLYLEQSRENMQKLSTTLRENYGQDLFSKVINQDVKKDKMEIIIVDGIRRESDLQNLKKLKGFTLVYVETDMKIRYERLIKRDENSDDGQKTFEEFQKDHQGESELQIKELKNIADAVLDNNGSLDDLYRQVKEVVRR